MVFGAAVLLLRWLALVVGRSSTRGNMSLERDFSIKWINILRVLHRIAKTQHVSHSKLIRFSLVVDSGGNPIWWTNPDCTIISPSGDPIQDWLNQL